MQRALTYPADMLFGRKDPRRRDDLFLHELITDHFTMRACVRSSDRLVLLSALDRAALQNFLPRALTMVHLPMENDALGRIGESSDRTAWQRGSR
jgi:hypothetical protein